MQGKKEWTVWAVDGIGDVLGTAYTNRKRKSVDFRAGFAEPSCGNTCVLVLPPSGQEDIAPLLDLPIKGQGRLVNANGLGIKAVQAIILPAEYQGRLVGVVMPVRRR